MPKGQSSRICGRPLGEIAELQQQQFIGRGSAPIGGEAHVATKIEAIPGNVPDRFESQVASTLGVKTAKTTDGANASYAMTSGTPDLLMTYQSKGAGVRQTQVKHRSPSTRERLFDA